MNSDETLGRFLVKNKVETQVVRVIHELLFTNNFFWNLFYIVCWIMSLTMDFLYWTFFDTPYQ